jgi:hypothetical protein
MNQSQRSYGIGQDPTTREYYVVIDGVRVATYSALKSALAHIDADREREKNPYSYWAEVEGDLAIETVKQVIRERAGGTA